MIAVLIVFCVLTFWATYRFVNRNKFKLIENFDSIGPAYPIVGHLFLFLGKSADEKVRWFCELASKYSKPVKAWTFTKLIIVINSPQDIQTVLNSPHCLEKGTPYKAMWSASGLIASHPTKWKPHRRLLNPSFNLQAALKLVPLVNETSRVIVKDLEPFCNQGEFSLLDIIGVRIMNNTLYSLLEYKFDKKTSEECYHLMDEIMGILGERFIKFYSSIIYAHIERILQIKSKDDGLRYQLRNKLEEAFLAGKRKYMNDIEKEAIQISTEEQLRNRPDGFLKRIYRMAYHNRLNEREMEENIDTLLYASTDTTTRSIGNIILCLAMNPKIQDKLYTELIHTIGDVEEIDFDTILKVEYLDRVIKESLRFLIISPVIVRRASKNIKLDNGVIPAGSDILIPIANIHRDKNLWGSNADKFDPDNFLPEKCETRHSCSFIPFSYGPRNCIGYRHAQISLKIIVTHLVRSYKFGTHLRPEDLIFGFGVTGKLRNDYIISIVKR